MSQPPDEGATRRSEPSFMPPLPPPAGPPPAGPAGVVPPPYQPGSASVPSYAGPPTSAVPSSGGPYASYVGYPAYAAPPAPAPRRRGGVIVLSVLTALFLLATGVLAGLYATKTSEADRNRRELVAQVSDRDTTISARDQEVAQLKKDLQAAKDETAEVRQQLTGTQNDRDEQVKQKAAIARCLGLLTTALAKSADSGTVTRAEADAIDAACDEADKYL